MVSDETTEVLEPRYGRRPDELEFPVAAEYLTAIGADEFQRDAHEPFILFTLPHEASESGVSFTAHHYLCGISEFRPCPWRSQIILVQ